MAQGFREIDRRFITAPSLLTIRVLSISLMQLKPHLKNKHTMDLAMSSPSIHLGLYRYKFNTQRNKNSANLYLSSSTLQRVWKYWRHSVEDLLGVWFWVEVNNSPQALFIVVGTMLSSTIYIQHFLSQRRQLIGGGILWRHFAERPVIGSYGGEMNNSLQWYYFNTGHGH